jgi:hypothetical protein
VSSRIDWSRLTNTDSIVALDAANKQPGVAMQTHTFQACNGVIWAEPRMIFGVDVMAHPPRIARSIAPFELRGFRHRDGREAVATHRRSACMAQALRIRIAERASDTGFVPKLVYEQAIELLIACGVAQTPAGDRAQHGAINALRAGRLWRIRSTSPRITLTPQADASPPIPRRDAPSPR